MKPRGLSRKTYREPVIYQGRLAYQRRSTLFAGGADPHPNPLPGGEGEGPVGLFPP